MAEEVGIVLSLRDNVSPTLKAIAGNAKAFDKDLGNLQESVEQYDAAQQKMVKHSAGLKTSLIQAGAGVKEVTKSYRKLMDEADSGVMKQATAEQQELKQGLADVNVQMQAIVSSLKTLHKTEQEGAATIQMPENGKSLGGTGGGLKSVLQNGALVQQVGQSISQFSGAFLESALGESAASATSSFISSVASGLTVGAMLNHPVIGLAVSTGVGAINAASQVLSAKDDVFKSYYNNLYDEAAQRQAASLEHGSAIAAQREKDQAIFSGLTDGEDSAFSYLAERLGISKEQVLEMVQLGLIPGTDAAWMIREGSEEAGSMGDETFSGLTATLAKLQDNVDGAMGKGYNDTRTSGLSDQIAAYGGELGNALMDLNGRIGEHKASMDNLSDQYQREALSAVLLGQETSLYDEKTAQRLQEMGERYAELKERSDAGDEAAVNEMAELKGQAESLATAAYESSDEYSAMIDAQQDSVAATRELTAAFGGWSNSYRLQQEKSKGRASTFGPYTGDPEDYDFSEARYRAKAYGMHRVPYNNYAALLHEGERVLTAREARELDRRSGGSVSVQVTGNSFSVRSDGDLDEIGEAIAYAIERKLYAGVS